jgi:hypothetical protein
MSTRAVAIAMDETKSFLTLVKKEKREKGKGSARLLFPTSFFLDERQVSIFI